MEDTYRVKAIILNRQPFKESDLSVTVYSAERGKQSLIARGAKKFRSKSAAHLEPICLSEIMVVRGKQYDYVGSAISENCFLNIKENLEKVTAASLAIKEFNTVTKNDQVDSTLFTLLNEYLLELDLMDLKIEPELLYHYFKFKLLAVLGYNINLFDCSVCNKKLQPGGSRLNDKRNGLICSACAVENKMLTVSDDCVKVLRLIGESNFLKLNKLKINKNLKTETVLIINEISKHVN